MALIETKGLSKSYPGVRALDSLEIAVDGRAIGLLGPNGAGKTTLVKVLLGLIRATTGETRLFGLDAWRDAIAVRRRIGYMPENESFIPGLSAVQYVSLAGRLVGMPARDAMARAHMVLNYAGIDEARYREIETYSTGMKQKVKLAQALVHHPELLILDEPTSGLDPRGRDEMLDLIRDLSRVKGIRVLLSTHILPDVERVCEDVLVMHRGKLVAKGRLDELTEKRGLAYEVRATGPVARFAEELATAGLGVERASEDGAFDDVELSVKLPEGAASLDTALILKAATAAGVELRHMAPVRSSLEALFRQLIVEAG